MSCGTCQKFKGNGVECGQTYLLGTKQMKYTPMSEKVGPCFEGYVEKREKELFSLSVPATEHSVLVARRCGDCQKYKGPDLRCGESFIASDGDRVYYSPYGDNAHGCTDERFVPKKVVPVQPLTQPEPIKFATKLPLTTILDFDGIVVDFEADGFTLKDVRGVMSREAAEEIYGLGMKTQYPKTTTQKETSNMQAIIRLADSQLNKQIEDFGGLSLDIREALETMQTEEKKEAAKTAAAEVMTLLKGGQLVITENVNSINVARRQEKAAKDRIESINRAIAYGKETSNFVPLGILTGHIYAHRIENEALRTVPKDWEPKPAEGQPAAAQ